MTAETTRRVGASVSTARATRTRPPLSISIVYTTARPEPRIDWLVDGLEAQAGNGDRIELVIVDLLGRPASSLGYRPTRCVNRLVETSPKPSPWQGPQRVTRRDFWAAASARNTGIVLCSRDYVVFLDDRCRLGRDWTDEVRTGHARRESVLAGAYDRIDQPRVLRDHRTRLCPEGKRGCDGGWLYGGNLALPLAWILEVNGFEEGTDGLAGEDCILGKMLVNAGRRVDFVPRMYVTKERPAGTHHRMTGVDKDRTPGDKARAAMERFGQRRRTEFTPDLVDLRRRIRASMGFPDVDPDARDWYDERPIREST